MGQESYSVAALAAAVGVPRTTINDWLSRYADYIDCSAAGKRKVYSEASLNVLKEIARLRDSGKSSAEIEVMLAQDHGVRPEVDVPAPEKNSGEPAADLAAAENTTSALTVPADPDVSQLPALKNIEQSAMELAGFIAELQKNQIQSVKRSRQLNWIMLAGIVILLAAIVFIYTAMRSEAAGRRIDAQKAQENMLKLSGELQKEAAGRRNDAEKARQEAGELQGQLRQLKQQNADQTTQMQQQLDKLSGELKNMEANRRNEQLAAQKNAEKMQSTIDQLRRTQETERQKLMQELNALRQEREKALREKAIAEQAAAEQKKSLAAKDSRIAEQQKSLEENSIKSRQQLEELQKRIEATSVQIDRLKSLLEKTAPADKTAAVPAAVPAAPPAEKTTVPVQ